jgi:hypothetical protein
MTTYLILGGAGLVGKQIARRLAEKLAPCQIVIGSLRQHEVDEALEELRAIPTTGEVTFAGFDGNVFVRSEFRHLGRAELTESPAHREALYMDLMGDLDAAYARAEIARVVEHYRPDVIVDCVNTATAISYQDAHTASIVAHRDVGRLLHGAGDAPHTDPPALAAAGEAFDLLLLSQALPQLVRHVQLLYRAMQTVGTRLYLKVGTTGTGGMGLNIPYTHSEDKPSVKLMTKTAVGFAHTGLLFLMARTPNGPIVKEVKPGAMIGYADICSRTVHEHGRPVHVYASRVESLDTTLHLKRPTDDWLPIHTLDLPVVDTGENGLFTKGEFEAITALRQMEFITPEEIAQEVILEIIGANTGYDVIAEIDSGIMNPTYRAGYLRDRVLVDLAGLERATETHSVALGQLGPPELSKLLWEAELLKQTYGSLANVIAATPEAIAERLEAWVEAHPELGHTITSIGVPILLPAGDRLVRGPFVRIPEIPGETEAALDPESIDRWAAKGWVDLRPANMALWKERFAIMLHERDRIRGRASAAVTRQSYLFEDIRIGEIVGWVFNNEQDGYRMK